MSNRFDAKAFDARVTAAGRRIHELVMEGRLIEPFSGQHLCDADPTMFPSINGIAPMINPLLEKGYIEKVPEPVNGAKYRAKLTPVQRLPNNLRNLCMTRDGRFSIIKILHSVGEHTFDLGYLEEAIKDAANTKDIGPEQMEVMVTDLLAWHLLDRVADIGFRITAQGFHLIGVTPPQRNAGEGTGLANNNGASGSAGVQRDDGTESVKKNSITLIKHTKKSLGFTPRTLDRLFLIFVEFQFRVFETEAEKNAKRFDFSSGPMFSMILSNGGKGNLFVKSGFGHWQFNRKVVERMFPEWMEAVGLPITENVAPEVDAASSESGTIPFESEPAQVDEQQIASVDSSVVEPAIVEAPTIPAHMLGQMQQMIDKQLAPLVFAYTAERALILQLQAQVAQLGVRLSGHARHTAKEIFDRSFVGLGPEDQLLVLQELILLITPAPTSAVATEAAEKAI